MFSEDYFIMFVSQIFISNNYINLQSPEQWLLGFFLSIITQSSALHSYCCYFRYLLWNILPTTDQLLFFFGIYGCKRVIELQVFKLFYRIREHKSYHYPLLYNPYTCTIAYYRRLLIVCCVIKWMILLFVYLLFMCNIVFHIYVHITWNGMK